MVDTTKVYYINDVWYASLDSVPVVPVDTTTTQPVDTTTTQPQPTIEDGFYLLGSMNEWSAEAAYKFAANTENAGEYYLNVTLALNDEFKVGKVMNSTTVTWYPDGNNFVVEENYVGAKTIYFRETDHADWASFGGYFYLEANTGTDTENICTEKQAIKVLRDGQLIILRDNHAYTLMGEMIR